MSREQERIRRKLETNPAMECNKVKNRYCPDLFRDFADTKDPRNQSYIEYSNDEPLGTVFYKGIAGTFRMQSRSMNIWKGCIRVNCRRCNRNRSMD